MTRHVRRLVFGLGNPGREYAATRHNVGFWVLDRLARREGLLFEPGESLEGYEGPSDFRWARCADRDALLVKPETFMNLSGEVVGPIAAWTGVAPEECLVVFDDLDLPLADLRIRPGGSSGGHRGLQSIIETLGTERIPRLRIGIGRSSTDAARHVLSRFSTEEQRAIDAAVAEAAEALSFWLFSGDLAQCMTRFHSRWKQGKGRAGELPPSGPLDTN
jgi:PTH1 family peptidyl-tRNA hydrolase